jgi:hypothetical protein
MRKGLVEIKPHPIFAARYGGKLFRSEVAPGMKI